jgi:hypothetical protein
MKSFEEWKRDESDENAKVNKLLILYMILIFTVAAFCA